MKCLPDMLLEIKKPIINDVPHITFEQTVQNLYEPDIYGSNPRFLLFDHFLQTICKVVPLDCLGGYRVVNIVNRSRPRLTSCLLQKTGEAPVWCLHTLIWLYNGVQSICDAEKMYGHHR